MCEDFLWSKKTPFRVRYGGKIFLSGLAGEDKSAPNLPTHTRPPTRVRLGAWSVDAGRGS
jgi:hypothetical protein